MYKQFLDKDFIIKPMTWFAAWRITGWTYEEPYTLYNMDGGKELVRELLDGSYYYVKAGRHNLVGYFCFNASARVQGGYRIQAYDDGRYVDIGLGMRPDLTGKGLGGNFLGRGIEFSQRIFPGKRLRLTVAVSNLRAVKVYERAGFRRNKIFTSETKAGNLVFMTMLLERGLLSR